VNALQEHWVLSEVEATKVGPAKYEVKTKGVTDFTLNLPAAWAGEGEPAVTVDGVAFKGVTCFKKIGGKWADPRTRNLFEPAIRKRHDLQGPIDDAFMGAFVFVRPTGRSVHPRIDAWVRSEMELAVRKWKVNFRGEVTVVDDVAVTDELMKSKHLILWGDAESNKVIARVLPKLPLRWEAGQVGIGKVAYDASTHVPLLIQPNPLASDRYVVLNTGYTFRQGSDVTNALQTPKLPDWAIVDVTVPPSPQWPGAVTAAGFFDEGWGVR
jgi:hypothetical protein